MDAVSGGDNAAEAAVVVLEALAHALERMVVRNELVASEEGAESENSKGLAAFRGAQPPGIDLRKYMERLLRYTRCSASCFVVSYVYIDRAAHQHPSSAVVSRNVHRLVLTGLLLASKFLDDTHRNNAFFAKVGGVTNGELNRMELELLFLLDFNLVVGWREFETYCRHLNVDMEKLMTTMDVETRVSTKIINTQLKVFPNGLSSSSLHRRSIDL
ncbi:cyclin-U1-1-like [Curcuma longa]|uniref:cyclin-U1-1-like n=1 Tax=Curcuma longa TaxID=136217 RepID=UPI003D9F63F4